MDRLDASSKDSILKSITQSPQLQALQQSNIPIHVTFGSLNSDRHEIDCLNSGVQWLVSEILGRINVLDERIRVDTNQQTKERQNNQKSKTAADEVKASAVVGEKTNSDGKIYPQL